MFQMIVKTKNGTLLLIQELEPRNTYVYNAKTGDLVMAKTEWNDIMKLQGTLDWEVLHFSKTNPRFTIDNPIVQEVVKNA